MTELTLVQRLRGQGSLMLDERATREEAADALEQAEQRIKELETAARIHLMHDDANAVRIKELEAERDKARRLLGRMFMRAAPFVTGKLGFWEGMGDVSLDSAYDEAAEFLKGTPDDIEAFNVEQVEREERRRDDTRRLYDEQAREELARSEKKQSTEQP